jgi:hypothetical protein
MLCVDFKHRGISENWNADFFGTVCRSSVRTSQETHYVSATEPNRLMLFGETVAVYCENRVEHTDTLWAELRSFSMLKQAMLQTGRLRVRFPMKSLNFF